VALAETERTEERKSIVQNATQFVREVRVELGKVTWPAWRPISPKTELWASTTVVVVAVLLLSIFTGLVDVILTRLVGLVLR
jgi:preprotein translocase subunit SecE